MRPWVKCFNHFLPQLAYLCNGNNSNIYLVTLLQGFSEMPPAVTGIKDSYVIL